MNLSPTLLHAGTINIETRKAFSLDYTHVNAEARYITGCDKVINVLCSCIKHEACMATFCLPAFVTSQPCPYLRAIYDMKQRTSRVVTTSVRSSVCSLVMTTKPSVRFSCNSVREFFIQICWASARCVEIGSVPVMLYLRVATNLYPPFPTSWAVWVKLANYGFRGTTTGESQTSLPKE
jgi:hypothetical protein